MEEKKVEEILQDEEIPVTEEASGEGDAVQAQDPETETAESDQEADEAGIEEKETDDPEAESDEDNTDGRKKGFFSKRKKGDKEKAAMEEKIAGLEDRVKRQMAEFENFRKRTEKEKQTMFSMGERNVIEKMLPIVDNFERGLAAVPDNEKDTALASGRSDRNSIPPSTMRSCRWRAMSTPPAPLPRSSRRATNTTTPLSATAWSALSSRKSITAGPC